MGRDPKATRQDRAAELAASAGRGPVTPPVARDWPQQGAEVGRGSVEAALEPFLLRDDGWLRIVPQNDGATVYFKWKWTAGPHRDHYVMTVYPQHQATEGLARLAAKVDAVDSGKQPPVRDHYFKG